MRVVVGVVGVVGVVVVVVVAVGAGAWVVEALLPGLAAFFKRDDGGWMLCICPVA